MTCARFTELDPLYSPKLLDLQGDIPTPCDVKIYHKTPM